MRSSDEATFSSDLGFCWGAIVIMSADPKYESISPVLRMRADRLLELGKKLLPEENDK